MARKTIATGESLRTLSAKNGVRVYIYQHRGDLILRNVRLLDAPLSPGGTVEVDLDLESSISPAASDGISFNVMTQSGPSRVILNGNGSLTVVNETGKTMPATELFNGALTGYFIA